MNSLKRYAEDMRAGNEHPVRSHRMPTGARWLKRVCTLFTIAIMAISIGYMFVGEAEPFTPQPRIPTTSPGSEHSQPVMGPYVDPTQVAQERAEREAEAMRVARGFQRMRQTEREAKERAEAARRQAEAAQQSTNKIETVINWAIAQRGKPYVFGASGPRTYDCSGLVMRAFQQVGINLPHYTGTMLNYGQHIPRSALQRGDIVFPTYGHVGIYLGNGQMVVAPHSGDVVKIQNVYAFYAARRLL